MKQKETIAKYRARIYICASYVGYVDCDRYELKDKPFRLIFYKEDESIVGHIEPKDGLIARVQIYRNDRPNEPNAFYTIGIEYVFQNKGPVVISEYESERRKSIKMLEENNGT